LVLVLVFIVRSSDPYKAGYWTCQGLRSSVTNRNKITKQEIQLQNKTYKYKIRNTIIKYEIKLQKETTITKYEIQLQKK
jgi:hypothetical protein